MANLTIRNVDDDVVEDLKRQAKQNNRSLEAELREILTRGSRKGRREWFLAEADRIAAMTPRDRPQTDSAELVRQMRDER